MNEPITDIERLMLKVESMREAQRNFFKHGSGVTKEVWKKKSIAMEGAVDAYLKELRRKGYAPENQKDSSEQKIMF